jgi:hypothetical protein
VLFRAYDRATRDGSVAVGRSSAVGMVAALLLVASFAVLFAHDDPRSYVDGTTSGSVSDVITPIEAVASMALGASALALAWACSDPAGRARSGDATGGRWRR